MASLGDSPNPWASSYDTYRDCSQGLCSIYCPQWCYIIFPPPPPDFGDLADGGGGDGDGGSSNFSPLIIAVIGILASAFILLSYYTIIAKYCRRRRAESERELSGAADEAGSAAAAAAAIGAEGLEEGLIKAIRVYKYRKSDGVVDCADCAVCLSEFEDNEGLRLLPKCNHAFHVPCIDTWLKSHSTCPLCRAHIAPFAAAEDDVVVVVAAAVSSAPAVVVVVEAEEERDSSVGVVDEESSEPKISVVDDRTVGMRRSVSLNGGRGFCVDRVLVADILREQEDDDEDEMVGNFGMQMGLGIGTSSSSKAGFDDDDDHNNDQICKWERSGALGLMRSPVAMRRSISSSRFVFTRYGKGENSVLPN